jgi:hypothetical protein
MACGQICGRRSRPLSKIITKIRLFAAIGCAGSSSDHSSAAAHLLKPRHPGRLLLWRGWRRVTLVGLRVHHLCRPMRFPIGGWGSLRAKSGKVYLHNLVIIGKKIWIKRFYTMINDTSFSASAWLISVAGLPLMFPSEILTIGRRTGGFKSATFLCVIQQPLFRAMDQTIENMRISKWLGVLKLNTF